MLKRLLLISIFLTSFAISAQEIMSTVILPYKIVNPTLIMIDDTVWVRISPHKAFGDGRCSSLAELEIKFDSHLLRDKKIIQDTTISKNCQHYAFYLDYVPYMRVNYDIYSKGMIQFLDYEDYIVEKSNILNFSEFKTNY